MTHVLNHTELSRSGQGSTKQYLTASKPKKLGISKTFFKPTRLIICVHILEFYKQNSLPSEAMLGCFTGQFVLVIPKTPPGCAGEKALAKKKEIKKNSSVEQKWFADYTSTIERILTDNLGQYDSFEYAERYPCGICLFGVTSFLVVRGFC